MVEKNLMKYSRSFDIMEISLKNNLRFYLTFIRTAKAKTQTTVHAEVDVEKGDYSFIANVSANVSNHSGNKFVNNWENLDHVYLKTHLYNSFSNTQNMFHHPK